MLKDFREQFSIWSFQGTFICKIKFGYITKILFFFLYRKEDLLIRFIVKSSTWFVKSYPWIRRKKTLTIYTIPYFSVLLKRLN